MPPQWTMSRHCRTASSMHAGISNNNRVFFKECVIHYGEGQRGALPWTDVHWASPMNGRQLEQVFKLQKVMSFCAEHLQPQWTSVHNSGPRFMGLFFLVSMGTTTPHNIRHFFSNTLYTQYMFGYSLSYWQPVYAAGRNLIYLKTEFILKLI